MNMIYVRGADAWAIPVWERPVEEEVTAWTRKAIGQTEQMRRFKETVGLQIPRDLQHRLKLATDKVTLTVNGAVCLSSAERSKPLCILQG